jgi:rubrerythrin
MGYNPTVESKENSNEEEEILYCYDCGQPLKWGDDKCPSCGEYQ